MASVHLDFFFFFFFFFCVSLSSIILLSLALIIGIFYCLNYTSPLFHLITTHHVSHFSLSSVIFSISALNIGILYYIDCISLLLHLIITHLVSIHLILVASDQEFFQFGRNVLTSYTTSFYYTYDIKF